MIAAKRRLTIERTYSATLDEIWALWTTKDGLESWWGPAGFGVTVQAMELKPGGKLVYVMAPTEPDTLAFMKSSGMPIEVECKLTYTEVQAPRRLGYSTLTDFVPGVPAYEVETLVELQQTGGEVRMLLTFDAMHDDEWTGRMQAGRESELGKLDALLAARA
jgi:uncharacterized protein YndB with AHSA1/START domain